ncbi:hypothetical protein CXF68_08235 [Tenacibaculum sp. Bg11-29]|uniref:tetratricopeptide repeat protein n=1 Tax=Tenacibaculum sp. Bg11-29 TaxID=2058306 RepID=UPI000C329108|nr:tetratricopeptide repeat protein [Tenacibaculum sp. Bg11-29]PKH50685.1 hypothetical protein CXF68_08235 [Tenacibaculum sp. Bg11-29]
MKEEHYLLFENYLSGNLSNEELSLFNDKLISNIEFKEGFILYRATSLFLKEKNENEDSKRGFEKKLKKISEKNFRKHNANKKIKKIFHFKYGIVASLLLLFTTYFFLTTSKPTYKNFVTYNTIDLTERSSNQLLTKAQKAFNIKDFKTSTKYFNQILAKDKNNTEIQLYNSFSLIELNKFTEAEKNLHLIYNGKSAYKNNALWYLALSKLKQEDYSSCILLLKKISEKSPHCKTAKKLLSKLE